MDGHREDLIECRILVRKLTVRTGLILKDITKIVCIGFIWLRIRSNCVVM
jgi:hypothetical protein